MPHLPAGENVVPSYKAFSPSRARLKPGGRVYWVGMLGTSVQAFGCGQLGFGPKSGSWAWPSFNGKLGKRTKNIKFGYMILYRPVIGRRWPLVMVGHVSWVPQAAWASPLQDTWAKVPKSGQTSITRMCWCDLGNRVRAKWHRTSVTQTAELSHVRWIPDHTPVISREEPRSRGVHVCGVNDAFRRSTSKEPLEELRPVRVTFHR